MNAPSTVAQISGLYGMSVRDTAQAMGTAKTVEIAAVSVANNSEFTSEST